MKKILFNICFILFFLNILGQDCSIISKANNITPDRLCSPVKVSWDVSYTGVNDLGATVQIRYDWNNGVIQTVSATQISPGIFQATSSTTYLSLSKVCNYHPQATLVVNGVICTSSTQEQIVTVWDDDNHNGGNLHINPEIYPICIGNGADVRFQDLTMFNCVPPQENDNPNVRTRWIQWIYGTDITMTGTPVTIDGSLRAFPYTGGVITLLGPVTGSGVWSDVINVANDKLIGQYFQVTLRNWNYCNPYDDPNIPGSPIDPENGDHPPVVTTAIILIVPDPDATITPIDTLCANNDPVTLIAHDPGGTWSGAGVTGNTFDPEAAGVGNHIIRYDITTAAGCSDNDEIIITVVPNPDATITPIDTLCENSDPIALNAHDPGGTWSGAGVTGHTFNPIIAGVGNHIIRYDITTLAGCSDNDEIIITVVPNPDATITPIDTLCVNSDPVTLNAHDPGGTWTGAGVTGNTFNPTLAGAGDHLIRYTIINPDCRDTDSIIITVMPIPDVKIDSVGIIFINSPSITLNATPIGGIFSGVGIIGNVFNPDLAGLGNHLIVYETIPFRYGCMGFDTIHIIVNAPPLPIANFEPDTFGCFPLTVRFNNNSLFGESYLWDFGDKVYSNEINPVHTYYIPGNYIVRLTVFNFTGVSFHQGTIIVYQNPTAIYSVYPTEIINNSDIVKFVDNSYDAETYLWDFGDGTTSSEKNPWHKYDAEGIYKIKLIVTSKDGCIDSSIYETPIVVDFKNGFIMFANAFRWNKSGPTGGYWTEGAIDNNVFRPFLQNVAEYKLIIYNRWGEQIYESNDFYKGWDGYFKNNVLAAQGVYVYKVTGKYIDGSTFEKIGDVTFLH